MKVKMCLTLACAVALTSCSSLFSPDGWPLTVSPQSKAVSHMMDYVKLTSSNKPLTKQDKALLTFLADGENVAAAIGEKNIKGSHAWSAAEVYLVEPGKHVSALCENGYQQKPVYFHYNEEAKTWYRVGNLEPEHSRGIPAVIVK